MEENKKKKKKLTLSVSSKASRNFPSYTRSKGKTSVVIEKKAPRRWGEKKFQQKDNNLNKPKSGAGFSPNKAQTNRNSSTEAKRKRTTAGNNENNSHLDEKKPVKSSKKKKRKENSDTDSTVKNPINTGRITPSGTNVPRSQKKSKKKKRK